MRELYTHSLECRDMLDLASDSNSLHLPGALGGSHHNTKWVSSSHYVGLIITIEWVPS